MAKSFAVVVANLFMCSSQNTWRTWIYVSIMNSYWWAPTARQKIQPPTQQCIALHLALPPSNSVQSQQTSQPQVQRLHLRSHITCTILIKFNWLCADLQTTGTTTNQRARTLPGHNSICGWRVLWCDEPLFYKALSLCHLSNDMNATTAYLSMACLFRLHVLHHRPESRHHNPFYI